MIDFVTISTSHLFPYNPLAAQHRLRYKSIIVRQNWAVPNYEEMEFDQYDNPASKYLVYSDDKGIARGVSRLYPTTLDYMLDQKFPQFLTNQRQTIYDPSVWEGSRFCVDETLSRETRQRIIHEIVVGYLEVALKFNIRAIIGLMHPVYWRNVFINSGWHIDYLGEIKKLEDGNKARAAWLPCTEEMLLNVRKITGIQEKIVNFGAVDETETKTRKAA